MPCGYATRLNEMRPEANACPADGIAVVAVFPVEIDLFLPERGAIRRIPLDGPHPVVLHIRIKILERDRAVCKAETFEVWNIFPRIDAHDARCFREKAPKRCASPKQRSDIDDQSIVEHHLGEIYDSLLVDWGEHSRRQALAILPLDRMNIEIEDFASGRNAKSAVFSKGDKPFFFADSKISQ